MTLRYPHLRTAGARCPPRSRTRSSTRRSVEPSRHFRFDDDGITNEIVEGRRLSTYFVPIAGPKKKGGAAAPRDLQGDWTDERMKSNDYINDIRRYVRRLAPHGLRRRHARSPATCSTYWQSAGARRAALFFCQLEALETAIYLTEVAGSTASRWIENAPARGERGHEPRASTAIAFKMATGSGKTVVMAMLIAWQALNKLANPQDAPLHRHVPRRHARASPSATACGCCCPSDPDNYYRERDLVAARPAAARSSRRTIVITNFHAFMPRETVAGVGELTKTLLVGRDGDAEPLHRDARPDGPPRLPRASGTQEEHRRPQRRGAPLLPAASRRRAERRS